MPNRKIAIYSENSNIKTTNILFQFCSQKNFSIYFLLTRVQFINRVIQNIILVNMNFKFRILCYEVDRFIKGKSFNTWRTKSLINKIYNGVVKPYSVRCDHQWNPCACFSPTASAFNKSFLPTFWSNDFKW